MSIVMFLIGAIVLGAESHERESMETSPELEVATLELVKAFENRDDAVSRRAIKGLIALGPYATAAVPTLKRTVENKVEQWDAIRALGAIGPSAKSAAGCLVTALGRQSESRAAKESLIQIGPCPAQVPRLVELLDDRKSTIRCNAAEVLGTYGEAAAPAVPKLVDLLKENRLEDPIVGRSAINALVGLGHHAVPFLANALVEDTYNQQRYYIACVLMGMGKDAREAIPALKRSLTDADDGVRWAAAQALHRIEGEGANVNDAELSHRKQHGQ